MTAPTSKLLAHALTRDRALDTGLTSLGVSAALVSASFAAYMVVIGPGGGARGSRPAIAALSVPNHPALLTGAAVPPDATAPETVDFTPTGSLPTVEPQAMHKEVRTPAVAVLTDFAVRDVFDGTAVVEAHGRLQMVTAGAMLEGAGEVLAIERRGGLWIVRTAGGVIRQRR
jgi:hypothetical protein